MSKAAQDEVRVRAARRRDAAAIARMTAGFTADEAPPGKPISAAQVRALGFGPRRLFEVLVAVEAGKLVGYALIYPGYDPSTSMRGLHLQDLFVVRERRRVGVGRALMAAVATQCVRKKAAWFTWFVLRTNTRAQRFYKALGAKRLESIPMYIDIG